MGVGGTWEGSIWRALNVASGEEGSRAFRRLNEGDGVI